MNILFARVACLTPWLLETLQKDAPNSSDGHQHGHNPPQAQSQVSPAEGSPACSHTRGAGSVRGGQRALSLLVSLPAQRSEDSAHFHQLSLAESGAALPETGYREPSVIFVTSPLTVARLIFKK